MDLTATVQTDPATSELIGVQDDAALGGWSGIVIRDTEDLIADLQRGDVINITASQIEESFGLTRLRGITYTTVTEGGDSLGYKAMTTDVLQDEAIAEAHEGMVLQFDDVVITNNDERFGEWSFASRNEDGSLQGDARGDDQSESLPGGSDMFGGGERLEFLRGLWSFSFGNYKLWPESATDVGMVTNVATEDEAVPETFALDQNYPNPFNPATAIRYEIGHLAQVKLEVFDVLGRRVATLVETQQAPGAYTVTFDARRLPSGLYLYRLEAGSKVETKQMILLK